MEPTYIHPLPYAYETVYRLVNEYGDAREKDGWPCAEIGRSNGSLWDETVSRAIIERYESMGEGC